MPQLNNVFPSLTVQENLDIGVYQRPKSFRTLFEFVGTSSRADRPRRRGQVPFPAVSARSWRWAAR